MIDHGLMLRRATPIDADIMAAIHDTAFKPPDAWSREVFDLQLQLPNVLALLHHSGGLILVRLAADEAEVLTLAVAPAARRCGVGSALVRESVAVAAGKGVHAIFLEVSVTNIAAQRIYTKSGFVRVGRRVRYYSDGSDALVLRLDLDRVDATRQQTF